MPEEFSMTRPSEHAPSAPPLISENLILKQLDTSSNAEEEIAALDLAFPVFRQLDNEHFFAEGWTCVNTGLGSKALFVGRGRERRYAGDKTLDRGRYWSVCNDRKGFDGSTLSNELHAYHGYMSRCEVHLFDSSCDLERLAELHNQGVIDLNIVLNCALSQFGNLDAPFLLLMIRAIEHGEKAKTAKLLPEKTHVFLYGLYVKEENFARLFDLRRVVCRRWLLDEFLRFELEQGERHRSKTNVKLLRGKETPSTIEELFPILLSPEIGGSNPFIQAIGSWLRCHGCDGIVFPSARSDFAAKERAGKLESSKGWNFVDFRGASPCAWQDHIGHIMSFSTYLGRFFSLSCTELGDIATIECEGLLKQNIGRFNTMAHHAKEGTDPSILDLTDGFLSILDISQETLAKATEQQTDVNDK
jgi:hypothetical protein